MQLAQLCQRDNDAYISEYNKLVYLHILTLLVTNTALFDLSVCKSVENGSNLHLNKGCNYLFIRGYFTFYKHLYNLS